MATPPGRTAGLCGGGTGAGQRRCGAYSHRELSKIKQMHPTFEQIAARQAAWKPSKKVVSGRSQNAEKAAGRGLDFHEIRRVFRRRPQPLAGRAALPGLRRSRAHRRPLPARHLACAAGPARGRDLVLQRLSRHGPAPEGDRRHGRDRDADGHRRRRHPQHRRHQPSAGRARARARRPARQGGGAGLHLRLCLQRDRHLDHRQAHPELPDPVGRLQPQFDDRGRAARRLREADLPPQRSRASRRAAARPPATGRS